MASHIWLGICPIFCQVLTNLRPLLTNCCSKKDSEVKPHRVSVVILAVLITT